MNEAYLRPRRILDAFSHLYPEAWRQVDDLRARRKKLGDWPDWCFLPLAGAYAIVSKGTTLQSIDQTRHVGILGALAAWRSTTDAPAPALHPLDGQDRSSRQTPRTCSLESRPRCVA